MLKGLLPSKWVIALVAILAVACVWFYQRNEINKATLRTTQTELDQARRAIQLQTQTILTMQRDATLQAELLRQANTNMSAIREQARKDTETIIQRDLGQEANVDALALQTAINEQFQRYLNNFGRISGVSE